MKESGRLSGLRKLLSRMFRFRSRLQGKQQHQTIRMAVITSGCGCSYLEFGGRVWIVISSCGNPSHVILGQFLNSQTVGVTRQFLGGSLNGRSALLGSGPSADTAREAAQGMSAIVEPARGTDGGHDA